MQALKRILLTFFIENLYNSGTINENSIKDISKELDDRIDQSENNLSHTVAVSTVSKLARKLKRDKHDGLIGLNSNCIIHGTGHLYTMLTMYFNMILVHGHASDILLLGTMCPLPKSNDVSNSDKYRAIALCSSIAKLFELVFIEKQKLFLDTDPLQFGFKQDRSTSMCSLTLQGIAAKFVAEGSTAHVILLDMSKAFDRVNYCQLFQTMLHRKMDPVFTRCLMNIYLNQKLRVKWDDHFSSFFSVTNGVKQGGVLSPILFCIYVDNLLQQLRHSSHGCYMGPHFVGALCYADDLVLISPSLSGLNSMLQICEQFALNYDLSFNAQKTQFIVFRRTPIERNMSVLFNHSVISEQQSVIHLGHIIYNQRKKSDIDRILASFYKQYNIFRGKFGHIPSAIQAKLLQTYCSSFYGSELLPLSHTVRLQVAWRKSLRQTWRIPYRSHCALVRCLTDSLCEKHMFVARFTKFALSTIQAKCDTISYIATRFMSLNCVFSDNIREVCGLLNITKDVFACISHKEVMRTLTGQCNTLCKSLENKSLASVVKELSLVRDNISICKLQKCEIDSIITDICLN